MILQINGETQELPSGLSVTALIEHLELRPERVAIELNKQIIRRNLWTETALNDGDVLEIVHFVGGGSVEQERQ
jgi:sulfur carrier protein